MTKQAVTKTTHNRIEDAPQDGTHIFLIDSDKVEHFAMWQKTRRMEKGRWVAYGKWVHPYTRDTITIEPVSWKAAPTEAEALKADVDAAMKQRHENEEAKR
jgi:hypothetical protein